MVWAAQWLLTALSVWSRCGSMRGHIPTYVY
jgi:hypothetical protein